MQDALTELIGYSWVKYRGCLIERVWAHFKYQGTMYDSLDKVKASIDKNIANLQKSITDASRKTT